MYKLYNFFINAVGVDMCHNHLISVFFKVWLEELLSNLATPPIFPEVKQLYTYHTVKADFERPPNKLRDHFDATKPLKRTLVIIIKQPFLKNKFA